jgi:hypothetical protein
MFQSNFNFIRSNFQIFVILFDGTSISMRDTNVWNMVKLEIIYLIYIGKNITEGQTWILRLTEISLHVWFVCLWILIVSIFIEN